MKLHSNSDTAVTDTSGSSSDHDNKSNGTSITCPCFHFQSIHAIYDTLVGHNGDSVNDSSDKASFEDRNTNLTTSQKLLLEWIRGRTNKAPSLNTSAATFIGDTTTTIHSTQQYLNCGGYQCRSCRKRGSTSLLILNAIRDSCRPFVETITTTTSPTPVKNMKTQRNGIIVSTSKRDIMGSFESTNDSFPKLVDSTVPLSKTAKPRQNHSNNKSYHNNQKIDGNYRYNNTNSNIDKGACRQQTNIIKNKRRIRPAVVNTVDSRGKDDGGGGGNITTFGNLVGLASEHSLRPPAPPLNGEIKTWGLSRTGPYSNQAPALLNQTTTVTTPYTPVSKNWAQQATKRVVDDTNAVKGVFQAHDDVTTPNKVRDNKYKPSPPCLSTPIKAVRILQSEDGIESDQQLSSNGPLNQLIVLYCSLIQNCLVPSTFMELKLLFRLLALSPDYINKINDNGKKITSENGVFCSILSTSSRCRYFACRSIGNLGYILKGLPVSMSHHLTNWSVFCSELPELTQEIKDVIQLRRQSTESSIHINLDSTSTAQLTIPFKEERDSRHNFKSNLEQSMYSNRESCRDSFLYQLRAFLNLKCKVVNTTQIQLEKKRVQGLSSEIVHGLLESNVSWFVEFFCDLLLQIGLVPLQETDEELLTIADQGKLQKLHDRLRFQSSNHNKNVNYLVTDAKADPLYGTASPKDAALCYFTGHQEFFFMFLTSADSYTFCWQLRCHLITKIQYLVSNLNHPYIEKQLRDVCLLSKFLGLIIFYPNWSIVPLGDMKDSLAVDALHQLSVTGLPVLDLLKAAVVNKNLIVCIPWIIELLKLSRWDQFVNYSKVSLDILSLLRQIQVHLAGTQTLLSMHNINRQAIALSLEKAFDETVGFIQATTMPMVALPSYEQNSEKNRLSCDENGIFMNNSALSYISNQVEDLGIFIERLSRIDLEESKKSSGISRKLRPSIIKQSQGTFDACHQFQVTPKRIVEDNTIDIHTTSTIDSNPLNGKLRESFFHQHRDLKTLCELAVSLVLKTMKENLLTQFVQPILDSSLSNQPNVTKEITEKCMKFSESVLEKKVRDTLTHLADENIHTCVIDVAIELAVSHGMITCTAFIESLIEGEMRASNVRSNTESRKQLFLEKSDDILPETKTSIGDELMNVCATAIFSALDNKEWLQKKTSEFITYIQAIEVSLDEMNKFSSSAIPVEAVLRPYFIAVLKLDDNSISILDFTLSDSGSTMDDPMAQWKLFRTYINVAIQISKTCRYGLRNVATYFLSKKNIMNLLLFCSRNNVPVDDCQNAIVTLLQEKYITSLDLNQVMNQQAHELCEQYIKQLSSYFGNGIKLAPNMF